MLGGGFWGGRWMAGFGCGGLAKVFVVFLLSVEDGLGFMGWIGCN